MARHGGCSADEAMAMLIDLAERMERPVQEVAADLLASSRQ